MQHAPTADRFSIPDLRKELAGSVIGPDDAGYDDARTTLMVSDLHPAVIIKAANVEDVKRAVNLARESGLEIAVRSGGHSAAAHGSTEGGILLDLARPRRDRGRCRRQDRLGRERRDRRRGDDGGR